MLDVSTIPQMLTKALRDGDILVVMPDPNILFGRAVLEFGAKDAATKDVPVAMHILMRTTLHGVPYKLESWFHCREVPFELDPGTYVVLRPNWTDEQRAKGIVWGRSQTNWYFGYFGRPYGYWEIVRDAWDILVPAWLRFRGPDNEDPTCSHFAGEILEHGDYALVPPENDAQLTPWDYLTSVVTNKCPIIGRIEAL